MAKTCRKGKRPEQIRSRIRIASCFECENKLNQAIGIESECGCKHITQYYAQNLIPSSHDETRSEFRRKSSTSWRNMSKNEQPEMAFDARATTGVATLRAVRFAHGARRVKGKSSTPDSSLPSRALSLVSAGQKFTTSTPNYEGILLSPQYQHGTRAITDCYRNICCDDLLSFSSKYKQEHQICQPDSYLDDQNSGLNWNQNRCIKSSKVKLVSSISKSEISNSVTFDREGKKNNPKEKLEPDNRSILARCTDWFSLFRSSSTGKTSSEIHETGVSLASYRESIENQEIKQISDISSRFDFNYNSFNHSTTNQGSDETSRSDTTESKTKPPTKTSQAIECDQNRTERSLGAPAKVQGESRPPSSLLKPDSDITGDNRPNRDPDLSQMSWRQAFRRYGRLTPPSAKLVQVKVQSSEDNSSRDNDSQQPSHAETRAFNYDWKIRHKCVCSFLMATIHSLFPILHAFDNYSLPGHLISDLIAGITVAVFQIPQSMAYGILAGVDPIYGLYVALVPVFLMALMSKSYHVSYGTFAVISMMLAGSIEAVRSTIRQQVPNILQPNEVINTAFSKQESLISGLVVRGDQAHPPESSRIIQNPFTSRERPYLYETTPDRDIVQAQTWQSMNDGSETSNPIFAMPTNIEILTSICILVGFMQVIMAIMRLGMLSLVFSDQLISSFTAASAIHVITSQIGPLFDLSLPPIPDGIFSIGRTWLVFFQQMHLGFNQYTAILSATSVLFLLGVKEILEPRLRRHYKSLKCLPSELILMAFLIFTSWFWQWHANFHIKIVGYIPTGLPPIKPPRMDLMPFIVQDSFTIALVSFAMNLSLVQLYARHHKYKIEPNQELFALGTTNIISSFFSCHPCASSISRSAVQTNLGCKSPITPIFGCAIVLSVILYFAPVLYDLPRSTLSCIIVVALKGIIGQVRDFRENWRLSKPDAITWLITFVSVIVLGVVYGLVIGIVSSLLMIFFR